MNKTLQEQRGNARTQRPQRDQIEMQLLSLDDLLDKNHRARVVWQYAESIDLSELYSQIKATDSTAGRNAIDPRILFALWLLATLEGITSARKLNDLTTRDIPYMWICGGVSVNYHRLSDFRVHHGELLERIMVDSISVLMHQNLITLETVAQDGMKVRANAGASSFRRGETLDRCQKEAQKHIEALKQEQAKNLDGSDARTQAAATRAARERAERIEQAKEELEALKKRRKANGSTKSKKEPRASMTDPECQRMKMGDGGFRPALNVQFATDGDTRMVVGVEVSNQGSDQGLMDPMHQQVQTDYGVTPQDYLVDGGFTKHSDIDALTARGSTVYGSLTNEKKQLEEGKDPYAARPKDSKAVADFRGRMGTEEGQQKYAQRAGIAEFPNAECRNRGLLQFRVRGIAKAKCQTLWHVLAHNFNRMRHLGFMEVMMES
jgi:transposase